MVKKRRIKKSIFTAQRDAKNKLARNRGVTDTDINDATVSARATFAEVHAH